jgi:NAD(P)H-dependent flavin oxidoreductase YrpB (nitropropane dioxygenase family)
LLNHADVDTCNFKQEINGRLLRNKFISEYGTRLASTPPQERDRVKAEAADVIKGRAFDRDVTAVYCGSGVGLVRRIVPAEELVTSLVTEAKGRLQRLGAKMGD